MLSYLKDANPMPAGAETKDQPAPLSGPDDYLTVAGHGKKLKQSTMLLAVLFVLGAAVVWFMIKKTGPIAANAAPSSDQLQIDQALAQLETMKREMDTQMNAVVGRFYQFANVNQIGVNELKKNPFCREYNFGPLAQESDAPALREQQQGRLMAEALALTSGLELWSVTSTPKGMCCMIGEKVLYVDDMFGELTVQSIEQKRVVLNYKGIPVELTIE
ncbi:MAG: hypothetical protein LLF76_06520 [Planctomycetaceae bacterium]|nr:hypothetical protein [Planctomycetaceae bacterium]